MLGRNGAADLEHPDVVLGRPGLVPVTPPEVVKGILDGLQESDSLILDPHKGLFLPYGSGAVLVKNAQQLKDAFSFQASYTQDAAASTAELSPSDLSPELSKHSRGPRLWLPLMLLGTRPFEAALEEKILLARYFHEQLQSIDGFEMGSHRRNPYQRG